MPAVKRTEIVRNLLCAESDTVEAADTALNGLRDRIAVHYLERISRHPVPIDKLSSRSWIVNPGHQRRMEILQASRWVGCGTGAFSLVPETLEVCRTYFSALAKSNTWTSPETENSILGGSAFKRAPPVPDPRAGLVCLSAPARRIILEGVAPSPVRIVRLEEKLGVGHPLISYHVKKLISVGAIGERTDGRIQFVPSFGERVEGLLQALLIGWPYDMRRPGSQV